MKLHIIFSTALLAGILAILPTITDARPSKEISKSSREKARPSKEVVRPSKETVRPSKETVRPVAAAHRSCHFKGLIPENSVTGVKMAARFGYKYIECDVRYTSDKVMVLMHDKTINRTMRNASDYSTIKEPVSVATTSFEDLRTKFVFESSNPEYRTCLPTLEEQLLACKECGITPILHSGLPESYKLAQKIMGDNWVCFNADYKKISAVRKFSNCLILWDPRTYKGEDAISELAKISKPCGMSSMKADVFNAEYIGKLRSAGYEFQSSIWRTPNEMRAVHDGASIMLSDWFWCPYKDIKPTDVNEGKNKSIKEGETVTLKFSREEFSAMTLAIQFKGSVEITINGTRKYTLDHENLDGEFIGLRMHDVEPVIEIKALGKTTIKSYKAEFYKM